MLRAGALLIAAFATLHTDTPARADAIPIPRTVVAVYDGREEEIPRFTRIHTRAEMPLNHLGLVLRFVDLREPLPDVAGDPDVRGVLSWLTSDDTPRPERYAAWLEAALAAGKRLVVLGQTGVPDSGALAEPRRRILAHLGVEDVGGFTGVTYDVRVVHADPRVVEFERRYQSPLPPYEETRALPGARAHLSVRRGASGAPADLVVTSPRGGYASGEWVRYSEHRPTWFKWYLDPFAFFRLAFATDDLPKPDVATLAGRRIYYSHIDGDGWRNVSHIDGFRESRTLAAEVVLRELIAPFPDMPVTVAPVGGDLSERWYGSDETRQVAREIFALPQVEAATHTMTHPFAWRFFADYSAQRERPFLALYRRMNAGAGENAGSYGGTDEADAVQPLGGYAVPRSYGKHPFDLDEEVAGSAAVIEALLPAGKRVTLLQWSGDTHPFPRALEKTVEAGLRNLNGGDSRFDPEYDSHGWVAPVGRQVGRYVQVYASNSNENTYTGLWTRRFFGQRYLVQTLERTEHPRRLRPANLYYHMYSGERVASLDALRGLLVDLRAREIAPVEASRYAAIGAGFLRARLTRLAPRRWRIEDRDALATLRFDEAPELSVDFTLSTGVVGARHYQGSLYVYLDEAHAAPEIALAAGGDAAAAVPYLEQSRWRVYALRHDARRVELRAAGFGPGEMAWRLPPGSRWHARAHGPGARIVNQRMEDGRLLLEAGAPSPGAEVMLTLHREAGAP